MAIKPGTSMEHYEDLFPELDMILIMTVEPGFGGQPLLTDTLEKIKHARSLITEKGSAITLQVDGGVTESNIAQLAELGADSFVAGSAIFNHPDRALEILKLRTLAQSASPKL